MNREEAIEKIHWALVAYIEDSAGRDSEEAKAIEEAWELIKKKES